MAQPLAPSLPGQASMSPVQDWQLCPHMRNELTLPTSFSGQRLSLTPGLRCTTYLAVECRGSVGSRPRPETGGCAWRWGRSCRQMQIGGASREALCSKATSKLGHSFPAPCHSQEPPPQHSPNPIFPHMAPRTSSSCLLRYAQTLPAAQLLWVEESPQILLRVAGLQTLCGQVLEWLSSATSCPWSPGQGYWMDGWTPSGFVMPPN